MLAFEIEYDIIKCSSKPLSIQQFVKKFHLGVQDSVKYAVPASCSNAKQSVEPGQMHVCLQLLAFCTKMLLWLILYFWRPIVSCILKCGFSQNFWLSLDTLGFFELARRHASQRSDISVAFRIPISEGNIL